MSKGKDENLITQSISVGKSVYGEKRISANLPVTFISSLRLIYIPFENIFPMIVCICFYGTKKHSSFYLSLWSLNFDLLKTCCQTSFSKK